MRASGILAAAALAALAVAGHAHGGEGDEPPVPGPLQVPARVINSVEVTLQKAANVPRGEQGAVTIRRYVADQVDFTKSAGSRARATRLVQGPDGLGLLCFYALGVKIVALRFADQAVAMGFPHLAVTVRSAADDVQQVINSKCGGPGGDLAMKEWNAIHDAAGKKIEYLNRQARPVSNNCHPIPAPGLIACAPTREEVYVPKTGAEWGLLCVALAAGFAAPELIAARVTWVEVFAASSAAAPVVVRGTP